MGTTIDMSKPQEAPSTPIKEPEESPPVPSDAPTPVKEPGKPPLPRRTDTETDAHGTTRRTLLQRSASLAAVLVAVPHTMTAEAAQNTRDDARKLSTPRSVRRGDMLYRALGKTGAEVSIVGVGGHHIGRPASDDEGIRIVRTALDHGVTFLDNCWDYHDGRSEERMGKALRDGYRAKAFLMTKIDGRTKAAAARQIDESLRRLETDHIDLMQHHEIIRVEDPDRIFAADGAHEAMMEARQAGKIRFVGFTGHKDPFVHLRMLDVAAAHGFHFDAVQMPLNVMDAHFRSFGREVLPRLIDEGIGVLAMKSMGDKLILDSGVVQPIECLHYAMNLPSATVITGIDSLAILDQALEAARTFQPLSDAQVTALLARTAPLAAHGKYELFKTSDRFDGTAKRPDWLG